ncbi:MAG TPA: hypothetical protein RMH85_19740 [Polyangiaceae bacterium LLY-WYZ-15_(1-7)]|nr:hypothetical protein [Myxococcales bacterium]MAT26132.1 hypothetical protein [Sandaracinus sp.]HJK91791.1 hypothetical protein [Polyangiaceae bacterium LLY-WYZ-15_(1-7)]MBJ73474.1 hypothetical protein [Sandaracinus sp.]HJL00489.1 hypothetical protein [Polyangiaceae bacterium LLY-WYZ-15_(1-7)]
MFGFVIGFASLVGLISVLRKGRCAGRFHGGDCGHHHHHHHGHGGPPWARHGRGPHRWMHRLFERLDTTPGQEKEIRAAVRDFMDEAWDLGGQLRDLPRSASETLKGELFDEAPLDARFDAQDAQLARTRVALKEALRRIHEALDEDQRKELASFLRRRGRRGAFPFAPPRRPGRGFGPYR